MCESNLKEYRKLIKKIQIQLLDGKINFEKSITGFDLTKKLVSHLKNCTNYGS